MGPLLLTENRLQFPDRHPTPLWSPRKVHQANDHYELSNVRKFVKILAVATGRALVNGLMALTLMLVVEFSISGNLEAFRLYLGASSLITLAFLVYQLLLARRRHYHASEPGPP